MSEVLTRGTATTGPAAGTEVELEPPDDDLEGWFCVTTDPWPCPADGCEFVAKHITAAHLIVVWDANDDPNILLHAGIAKGHGRNPRVVEYERSMGPAFPYYSWEAAGRPVHAVRRSS